MIELPWWAVGVAGLVLGVLSMLGLGRLRGRKDKPTTTTGPAAPPKPEPPKHTANEHEDHDSAHEADAVATAAERHDVAPDRVSEILDFADKHRRRRGDDHDDGG